MRMTMTMTVITVILSLMGKDRAQLSSVKTSAHISSFLHIVIDCVFVSTFVVKQLPCHYIGRGNLVVLCSMATPLLKEFLHRFALYLSEVMVLCWINLSTFFPFIIASRHTFAWAYLAPQAPSLAVSAVGLWCLWYLWVLGLWCFWCLWCLWWELSGRS